MLTLAELLSRWDSNEGKPYKGELIDWSAYTANPSNIGCMCAQGQVLHLLAGWSPDKLSKIEQEKADRAVAKQLNISIAHSILLRSVNDKADGAPSVVLTQPDKILGDQARIVLAFWLHLDGMKAKDWVAARVAAQATARATAWDVAWVAAQVAAWDAARVAAQVAAQATARAAARDVAWDVAWVASYACGEIQGARLLRERGKSFFFLPLFGFAEPEAIPALPDNYGRAA